MNSAVEATQFPRWVYMALAMLASAIGLASSWITAKFFVLGLERLEPDPTARDILMATGLLMIATELAAFGIAALLPKNKLRSLKIKLIVTGLALLAFEVATICVTQGAIDQANTSASVASTQRIQELQATIKARREAAQSLRSNGAQQSTSSNAWTRTLGAAALRDALKVESEITPLSHELAQLQASVRPTTDSILGTQGVMLYGVARGLLISAMGLVMFGVAGALVREGMTLKNTISAEQSQGSAYQQLKPARQDSTQNRIKSRAANEDSELDDTKRPASRKEWWRKMLGIPSHLQAA